MKGGDSMRFHAPSFIIGFVVALVCAVALWGMLARNGRYQAFSSHLGPLVLDTRTGDVFRYGKLSWSLDKANDAELP